ERTSLSPAPASWTHSRRFARFGCSFAAVAHVVTRVIESQLSGPRVPIGRRFEQRFEQPFVHRAAIIIRRGDFWQCLAVADGNELQAGDHQDALMAGAGTRERSLRKAGAGALVVAPPSNPA